MKSFDFGRVNAARRALSLIALAAVLCGTACSAGDDDDGSGTTGTGGAPGGSNASGGSAAAGSGGKGPAGSGGVSAAVAGSGGGAAGMTPGGTGGSAGGSNMPDGGGMAEMTDGGMMTTDPHSDESACLDGITDYGSDGPFMYESMNMGAVKIWMPDTPAGCKVPVIHLANGTGATCSAYLTSLQRMASHGFIVTCYEDMNTGAGDQGVEALDTVLTMFPDKARHALGSTGHSQGGQASFVVLQKAEAKWGVNQGDFIHAGLAMQPASGFGDQPERPWAQIYADIKSPMFMFSGVGTDGLVAQSWVMDAFNAMSKTTETYFWARNGSTHIPVPNGEEQQISIPWFRWKLLGDNEACKAFKAIPQTDTSWMEIASNSPKDCM
jgi:hypothetical protein